MGCSPMLFLHSVYTPTNRAEPRSQLPTVRQGMHAALSEPERLSFSRSEEEQLLDLNLLATPITLSITTLSFVLRNISGQSSLHHTHAAILTNEEHNHQAFLPEAPSLITSMSKPGKKGGGKRPREHKDPPPEEPLLQDFAPAKYSPQPSPAYGSSSFSDVYQPSVHRSGGLGPLVQPGSMHSTQTSFTGKVAIPALRTSQTPESRSSRKGRTQHACDACRKAKAGCSGGNPCSRCKTMKSSCVYGDGKREKEKKYGHFVQMCSCTHTNKV